MLLWCVLYAVVFISGGTFSQIISSSDLNCDFSEKCFWRNGTNGMEDSGEFVSGTNLEMDKFHKITALRPEKDDVFIYSSALGGRQTALLISDTVNCQLGGASLKYWYWKTGVDVLLDICIRQPPGRIDPAALKCYDGLSSTFAQQWIFRSVELPPISQPFELLFRATYTAPLDLIALDDIQYDAILCESSNTGSSEGAGGAFGPPDIGAVPSLTPPLSQSNFFGNDLSNAFDNVKRSPPVLPLHAANIMQNIDPPKSPFDDDHFGYSRASAAKTYDIPKHPTEVKGPGGPRLGPQFESRCPPLDCNFDSNTFCDYITVATDSDLLGPSRPVGELRDWTLTKGKVENTLTGIPNDLSKKGGFLFAGGITNASDQFILSTRTPFTAPAASRLDFFVYLAGVAGRLRVCFDTLVNCPFEITGKQLDVAARQWNNYFITVPEGSHAIHFVADHLRKNYVIGLDNIQLLSKYGMSAQPC